MSCPFCNLTLLRYSQTQGELLHRIQSGFIYLPELPSQTQGLDPHLLHIVFPTLFPTSFSYSFGLRSRQSLGIKSPPFNFSKVNLSNNYPLNFPLKFIQTQNNLIQYKCQLIKSNMALLAIKGYFKQLIHTNNLTKVVVICYNINYGVRKIFIKTGL